MFPVGTRGHQPFVPDELGQKREDPLSIVDSEELPHLSARRAPRSPFAMPPSGVAMDGSCALILHDVRPTIRDVAVPLCDQIAGGVARIDDRDGGSGGLNRAHPVEWHSSVRGHDHVRFAESRSAANT